MFKGWSVTSDGYFPISVDHINRLTWDNRPENLRDATYDEQNFNQGPNKRNTSGVKGVSFHKTTGKWPAKFTYKGKHCCLRFFNKHEAIAQRKQWEKEVNDGMGF